MTPPLTPGQAFQYACEAASRPARERQTLANALYDALVLVGQQDTAPPAADLYDALTASNPERALAEWGEKYPQHTASEEPLPDWLDEAGTPRMEDFWTGEPEDRRDR